MDVVSRCPLPVAGRIFRARAGAYAYTFVVKATFALAPGKLALAAEQQPINEVDRPWSDAVKSLYAAADLVPRKPRADVVLIGNAYAPGGIPVQKLVARLVVGDVDKAVEVSADRTLRADGTWVNGPPFASLPLLYERAAGGPGTDNPVGIAPSRDAYGSMAMPNLTPPGVRIGADQPIPPVGFGPIAVDWPSRRARLGRYADDPPDPWQDMPADLDVGYFNVAPADQQTASLSGDERIVLENLHPKHPQLVMALPGLRIGVTARIAGGEKPAQARCDTLWIDTSREICCLTYRGHIPLGNPAEAGWVVVTLEDAEAEPAARSSTRASRTGTLAQEDEPERPTPIPPRPRANTVQFVGGQDVSRALPFQAAPPGAEVLPPPRRSSPGNALPFRFEGAPGAQAPRGASPLGMPASALTPAAGPRPFQDPATLDRSARPTESAGATLPPSVLRPSSVAAPPPSSFEPPQPAKPQAADSPWALASSTSPAIGVSGASAVGIVAPVTPPTAVPPVPGDFRGGGGALLASNAAAGAAEVRPARPAEPARIVAPAATAKARTHALELLYLDPAGLPRMRRVPAWKKLLAALEDRPLDPEDDDPAAAKDPVEVEERREALEILLRGDPSDAGAVEEALGRAVRDDGRFVPPTLLLAGELEMRFDEIEGLKATVAIVTPLAGNDESVRASLDAAKGFLELGSAPSAPAVADGLGARVRETWGQGKRAVPLATVEGQVERALVEQRAYQRRTALGGRRLRALFHLAAESAGSDGTGGPLVAYLPEAMALRLPMAPRFKVRIVARAHPPLDAYETSPLALEVMALARLCPPPRMLREPERS